jgi:hypothetical protein
MPLHHCGLILKNLLIPFCRLQTKQPEMEIAAINKIKVTILQLTETIMARAQKTLSILSFWLSFFWNKFCARQKDRIRRETLYASRLMLRFLYGNSFTRT